MSCCSGGRADSTSTDCSSNIEQGRTRSGEVTPRRRTAAGWLGSDASSSAMTGALFVVRRTAIALFLEPQEGIEHLASVKPHRWSRRSLRSISFGEEYFCVRLSIADDLGLLSGLVRGVGVQLERPLQLPATHVTQAARTVLSAQTLCFAASAPNVAAAEGHNVRPPLPPVAHRRI